MNTVAAWQWWAILDLLNEPDEETLNIHALHRHLEDSALGLNNLAGYASTILDAPHPSDESFLQGIDMLIHKGSLAKGEGEKLIPAPFMQELARQYQAELTFMALSTNILQAGGTHGTTRLHFIHPVGGSYIVWYKVGQEVTLLNLPYDDAITMVMQILTAPRAFFLTGSQPSLAARPVHPSQQNHTQSTPRKSRWPLIIAILAGSPIVCCLAFLLVGTLTGYIRWQGFWTGWQFTSGNGYYEKKVPNRALFYFDSMIELK